MDEFELPEDLANDVEVVYLQDDEEIEDLDNEMDQENETVEDMAKVTFAKHSGSIFSSALCKNNGIAVTGGEDDMAYVWNTENGELLYECTGHKDSVTSVEFNYNCKLIVTADMGGLIQVWDVDKKNLLWCNEGDDILFLFWHNSENILIVGTQSGDVYIWQVPQGNCKILPSFGHPANCGKLTKCGKKIAVGYQNGVLKLWDIKNTNVIWTIDRTYDTEIHSLDINENNSLIVVGPQGDCFKMADGKFVSCFKDEGDVEGIVFNQDLNVVVTGTSLGKVNVFDLARGTLRYQFDVEKFVTVFKWVNSSKLAVGTVDGLLFVVDIRGGVILEKMTGHLSDILSLNVASDGSFALTTSEDATAKIFAIKP